MTGRQECGACVDDGTPHRAGVRATQDAAQLIDPKKIARFERRGRWVAIRAARREDRARRQEARRLSPIAGDGL